MNEVIKIVSKEYPVVVIGDEKAILNSDTGKYLIIGGSGSFIWELISINEYTVDGLINELGSTFSANIETIKNDTLDFIEKLVNEKIVVLV